MRHKLATEEGGASRGKRVINWGWQRVAKTHTPLVLRAAVRLVVNWRRKRGDITIEYLGDRN